MFTLKPVIGNVSMWNHILTRIKLMKEKVLMKPARENSSLGFIEAVHQ